MKEKHPLTINISDHYIINFERCYSKTLHLLITSAWVSISNSISETPTYKVSYFPFSVKDLILNSYSRKENSKAILKRLAWLYFSKASAASHVIFKATNIKQPWATKEHMTSQNCFLNLGKPIRLHAKDIANSIK